LLDGFMRWSVLPRNDPSDPSKNGSAISFLASRMKRVLCTKPRVFSAQP
jgi:hypothetical protein